MELKCWGNKKLLAILSLQLSARETRMHVEGCSGRCLVQPMDVDGSLCEWSNVKKVVSSLLLCRVLFWPRVSLRLCLQDLWSGFIVFQWNSPIQFHHCTFLNNIDLCTPETPLLGDDANFTTMASSIVQMVSLLSSLLWTSSVCICFLSINYQFSILNSISSPSFGDSEFRS